MPEVWVVGVVAHSAGRGDFWPGQPCRFAFLGAQVSGDQEH